MSGQRGGDNNQWGVGGAGQSRSEGKILPTSVQGCWHSNVSRAVPINTHSPIHWVVHYIWDILHDGHIQSLSKQGANMRRLIVQGFVLQGSFKRKWNDLSSYEDLGECTKTTRVWRRDVSLYIRWHIFCWHLLYHILINVSVKNMTKENKCKIYPLHKS